MNLAKFVLRSVSLFIVGPCVLTMTLQGESFAYPPISSVQITPPHPTEGDSVRIEISGYFTDACWRFSGGYCGTLSGSEVSISVHGTDSWLPGHACALVLVPYGFSCDYGELPTGHYVVTVTEHHSSLREPLPDVLVAEFDVSKRAECVKGVVEGPVSDLCGEFLIVGDPGFEDKVVHVSNGCAAGGWDYWMSLVGRRVEATGFDQWREHCGFAGQGGFVFCVQEAVPTQPSRWSEIKTRFR